MSTELLLPSLILPVLLGLLAGILCRKHSLWLGPSLLITWLVSFSWLRGLHWPPTEALDGLPAIALAAVLAGLAGKQHTRLGALAHVAVLVFGLLSLAWPVLRHGTDVFTLGGLLVAAIAGIASVPVKQRRPASVLSLTAGGLALATALDGSLLLGQLAAALASLGIPFAIAEWRPRPFLARFGPAPAGLLGLILLILLVHAWLYAELPAGPSLLLLLALLPLRLAAPRAALITPPAVAVALTWLLLNADESGY